MEIIKIRTWLGNLVRARQVDEDRQRQELILNILLIFSLLSFFIINIIRIADYILYVDKRGLPLGVTLIIFFFFAFLFYLSRRGKLKTASVLLIITFAIPMIYSLFVWGADLPAALLLAVLVITLSGILLGARLAFLSTFLIALMLIIFTYLQGSGLIPVQSYWRCATAQIADAASNVILLFIIAAIAWLFIRTINRALKRARESEKLLQAERDSLEQKVIERTQEIQELEADKINQLYRFAEFGRLSSGIFHDLINPLTAVSLNLEQIKSETDSKILSAKSYLGQALLATGKMESLILSIKKQLARENIIGLFSVNQEIEQIMQILCYKARRAGVEINFLPTGDIKITGDALKFGQIISNLLANAIEACEESSKKEISITLNSTELELKIIIADSGGGIAPEIISHIFEPFFSTKKTMGRGLGLGLASTKTIVEKDFSGTIHVNSQVGQGTTFTIILPR
ncbi:MAG: ATP-binding protein [Patescibacteria group bacterium]